MGSSLGFLICVARSHKVPKQLEVDSFTNDNYQCLLVITMVFDTKTSRRSLARRSRLGCLCCLLCQCLRFLLQPGPTRIRKGAEWSRSCFGLWKEAYFEPEIKSVRRIRKIDCCWSLKGSQLSKLIIIPDFVLHVVKYSWGHHYIVVFSKLSGWSKLATKSQMQCKKLTNLWLSFDVSKRVHIHLEFSLEVRTGASTSFNFIWSFIESPSQRDSASCPNVFYVYRSNTVQYHSLHWSICCDISHPGNWQRDCTPAIRGLLTFATLQNFAISTLIRWLGMLRMIASKHHPIIPFDPVVVIVLSPLWFRTWPCSWLVCLHFQRLNSSSISTCSSSNLLFIPTGGWKFEFPLFSVNASPPTSSSRGSRSVTVQSAHQSTAVHKRQVKTGGITTVRDR